MVAGTASASAKMFCMTFVLRYSNAFWNSVVSTSFAGKSNLYISFPRAVTLTFVSVREAVPAAMVGVIDAFVFGSLFFKIEIIFFSKSATSTAPFPGFRTSFRV